MNLNGRFKGAIARSNLASSILALIRRYRHDFQRARFRQDFKLLPPRIVIGASGHYPKGWIRTEQHFLDLLKADQWAKYFKDDSIVAILAESVWEYLTLQQGETAARTCHRFLQVGGYLRASVPDGLHPDPDYLSWVRPGGGVDQTFGVPSRTLFTYRSFTDLFRRAGFNVCLLEYHDEQGRFHFHPWNPADGLIVRSSRFDARNRNGRRRFTQIIVDAVKVEG